MASWSKKRNPIIKLLLVFVAYLAYTKFFAIIFNLIGITDSITISFVADLVFFLGIVILYKDTLKQDFIDFFKKFNLKRKLLIIIGGAVVIFLINILGGIITEIIFPGQDMVDENTEALYSLGSISTIYTIFKAVIFSVIAEILVYQKTVRDVLDNKWIFIVVSSLIYALMNIAYSDFNVISIIDLIRCFAFGIVLSFIYIRTNNIVSIMFVKFVYNLFPLALLLTGIGE